MAVDMFIKIEGVDGESKDSVHGDEIDVLAWSWGMSQSGSFHVGGGGGAGKANFQDLSFTKYIDSATHLLMLKCANGAHIPTAVLTVRKAGTEALEYIVFKMKKILVTSVSSGGSGGEDRLTENVTLNFAQCESFGYTKQKDDGSADGAAKEFKWDIEGNVAL